MRELVSVASKRKDPKFEIQFWSEPATVSLIECARDPLNTIGVTTRGYSGVYSSDSVTDEEIALATSDLNSTKLGTPLEMIYQVFLIRDVTRSFTHQLVRTRLASYVQESMRFLGHQSIYKVRVPNSIINNAEAFKLYIDSCSASIESYEEIQANGISGEESREVLPHSILTSIFMGISMSSLRKMYAQRMCCQAQPGQWQIVMKQIKDLLIQNYGEEIRNLISAPYERGESCGYRASFDRPCSWQKDKP